VISTVTCKVTGEIREIPSGEKRKPESELKRILDCNIEMKRDRESVVLEDEMLRCATLSRTKDIIPYNSLQVYVKNEKRTGKNIPCFVSK
jgi:hypothetical protein